MRVAAVFSNHMVLQRDKRICVWGEAENGERITAELGMQSAETIAEDGKWMLYLPPMQAVDGLTLTIRGANDAVQFADVSIGEVWLCGGQSNMEFEIQNERNGKQLLQNLMSDCCVRFYYTPKQRMKDADFDANERNTSWQLASPENSKSWSAVGLYFALELRKRLGVTVGLIGCNWGGTTAYAWIPWDTAAEHRSLLPYLKAYTEGLRGKTLEQHILEYDAYQAYQTDWDRRMHAYYAEHPNATWNEIQRECGKSLYPGPLGPKNEMRPGGLYHTMLQRVCPYTLRGFLYYQGESDDCRPDCYATLLRSLITKWRSDFGDEQLPFLNVQLPMSRVSDDPDYKHWCKIREAQLTVYQTMKNTGLAVIADCGELDNLHPKDKSTVGHRLALQAFCEVYGIMSRAEACPPMYRDYYVIGNKMTLLFENACSGFLWRGNPVGFELAGADKKYYPAQAFLGAGEITLVSKQVSAPLYARYAWSNYTDVPLYGANNLPVSPFRTHKNDE